MKEAAALELRQRLGDLGFFDDQEIEQAVAAQMSDVKGWVAASFGKPGLCATSYPPSLLAQGRPDLVCDNSCEDFVLGAASLLPRHLCPDVYIESVQRYAERYYPSEEPATGRWPLPIGHLPLAKQLQLNESAGLALWLERQRGSARIVLLGLAAPYRLSRRETRWTLGLPTILLIDTSQSGRGLDEGTKLAKDLLHWYRTVAVPKLRADLPGRPDTKLRLAKRYYEKAARHMRDESRSKRGARRTATAAALYRGYERLFRAGELRAEDGQEIDKLFSERQLRRWLEENRLP